MTDSPRFQFRLPHWSWFHLPIDVLVIVAVSFSIWLPYHREQQVIEEIESWGGKYAMERSGLNVFHRVVHVELEENRAITDASLAHLSRFRRLQILSLKRTRITDVGLAHLRESKDLEWLCLDDTAVTDVGLALLTELTNLRELRLRDTAVSDAGLAHLKGMSNLRFVDLGGTAVTRKAVEELQKALPDCKIRPSGL